MIILLKGATIVDKKSNYNFTKKDILINNGIITDISDNIDSNAYKTIILENLHISRGWMDTSVSFGEPGFEERETISNGLYTAAASGFTSVLLNPNCFPLVDSFSSVEFLKRKSKDKTSQIYPIANLTVDSKGEELSSLYDMKKAGAVAFGDYKKVISDSSMLKIALEYTKTFGGRVISFCQDENLSYNGVINEGLISTENGLKGIPDISESILIFRDIEILRYTGGKLHIPYVNTKKGVEIIKNAKKESLDITSSVSISHIVNSDHDILDFDTNLKLNPPLRKSDDIKALKEGLIDGTIDFITSMHEPIDEDNKKVVFDDALPGTISLECTFGLMLNNFPLEKTIELLTKKKSIFNVEEYPIEIGNKADLTLFNPDKNYTFTERHILSTSKNCSFIGKNLNGIVYGSINNNKITLNDLWT